ncbi:5-dehydro-4-deoxyglucarate dehydratase [Nisaea acidiphila]|uniref:Probable 5-dehydro-4-deoxyglucarate dehydratase n=1 Tax=Nisaea acidiphila TaxID=1862145 RepID=A0A9J7ATI6_9PROT|nr:5-dehydro-4-deoxyglucarate dehydratase [Nisaea acidiphila]UUX50162.1 5-dehydro-4-deoxyglucarate dehydratase [Nisaea acidiphila]
MPLSPQELKTRMGSGLLSFPVTHFDSNLNFAPEPYKEHVSWLSSFDAATLFAAGGTGEYFSLGQEEYPAIIRTAVEAADGRCPVVAGCGVNTARAIADAQAAEAAGADGVLLLPSYLMAGTQDGQFAHVKAVCDSIGIGVVVYNRATCRLTAETIARLAEQCPNLIGFKDGVGEIDEVTRIRTLLGDRLVYVGGMPTHELFASAYDGVGFSTYSSAVFNFVPELALDFYRALRAGDRSTTDRILKDFFHPFAEIRDRVPGYAVSLIKGGLRAVGRDPGPVRPPLSSAYESDVVELEGVIEGLRRAA